MGYPLSIFVDTIDDNLLCSVCSGILQEAVLTPCGHSFCSLCLETWLGRSRPEESGSEFSYAPNTLGSQLPREVPESRSQVPGSRLHGSQASGSQVPGSDAFFWESFGNDDVEFLAQQNPGSVDDIPEPRNPGSSANIQAPQNPGSSANIQVPQAPGSTCPECRTWINLSQIHPIRSLRSLILSMTVYCKYTDEGCTLTMPLEKQSDHMESCNFARVDCAGCGVRVQRNNLADHQLSCQFILSLYTDRDQQNKLTKHQDTAHKINHLSKQLKALQSDLTETRLQNELLSTQLHEARKELEHKQRHLQQIQNICFDPDYNYGLVNNSVGKLSGLISRFLMEKPSYIDSDRIFQGIKRCYDNFGRCGTVYEDDVWMLLATATASNWFSPQQKQHIRVWQMSLARYKQYTQWTKEGSRPT